MYYVYGVVDVSYKFHKLRLRVSLNIHVDIHVRHLLLFSSFVMLWFDIQSAPKHDRYSKRIYKQLEYYNHLSLSSLFLTKQLFDIILYIHLYTVVSITINYSFSNFVSLFSSTQRPECESLNPCPR